MTIVEQLADAVRTCPGCGYIKPLHNFQGQSRCKWCRSRQGRGSLRKVEIERIAARERAAALTAPARTYQGVRGGLLLAGYVR